MSTDTLTSRISHPAFTVPGAMDALQALGEASKQTTVPETTLYMVHLRASQINGCGVCVDMHTRELKRAGEQDRRIYGVAAWREMPWFSDAERAALALTEEGTRVADRGEVVSDEVWEEAARHYDEAELSVLVLNIAQINLWNRLNAITRQIAGKF
ncbi:MAG TPA: carboxymuconolactone decarboxylase family protein [Solirubrobacteraceae bacterium]